MSNDIGESEATERFLTVFEQCAVQNGQKPRQYDYQPRSTDILVVGPPKTGTTWVQQILHQMRTKGDMSFNDIYDVSWWLPYYFMPCPNFDFNADQPAEPRVLKSHERYETLPRCEGMKYILIFRDPIDTSWSYMRFLGGFLGAETDTLSTHLMLMTADTEICKLTGGVSELVPAWWPYRERADVLWLYYEDLKKDLPRCVDIISKFVNIPLNEAERQIVIKNSSFEFMVQHKEKFSGDAKVFAAAVGLKDWKPRAGMVREGGGQVGQGLNNLPQEVQAQNKQAWKENIEEKLGFKNYAELYEKTSILK